MNKDLLLVLNPCAGLRRANRFLPEIIRMFSDHGYDTTVYVTACAGDAEHHIQENPKHFDRVVCIGGDGTLNETIAGVTQSGRDCAVGYIPAGTTNDFANSLGLSSDIMKACQDCVEGRETELDIGRFNGRYFIYTASCGAFAKAAYSTTQAAKNVLGHFAYIVEGIGDIPNIHPMRIRFETDDKVYEDEYVFCSVTSALSVGGVLKLDPGMVQMDDGLFEVMLIRYPKTPIELTRILAALNSFDLPNELIEFFRTSRLHIETEQDTEWTLDGERAALSREFEVENLQRRMKLVLPEASAVNEAVANGNTDQ